MVQRPGFSGFQPASSPPRVVLLHPPRAAGVAHALADVWQAVLPSALFTTFAIAADGLSAGRPPYQPSVVVGLRGAEAAAVRLGLDPRLPTCSGVLVAGAAVPHLGPLAEHGGGRTIRLRMVWEVEAAAADWTPALAELLRWYRAARLDAEGAVVPRRDSQPSRSLARVGAAYLAELVVHATTRARRGAAIRTADASGGLLAAGDRPRPTMTWVRRRVTA